MSHSRVANTSLLEKLIDQAHVLGFNRSIDPRRIRLNKGGMHILTVMLYDHRGMHNQDIVHHRVEVMAAGEWTDRRTPVGEPLVFMLDVRASEWDELMDAEVVDRAVKLMADKG